MTLKVLVGLLSNAPLSALAMDTSARMEPAGTGHVQPSYTGRLLLAQDEGAREMRERKKNLSGEAAIRKVGDKTSIDFEAADISGARRTPMGSMINQNRANKEYDFVKIRLSWHPEMINSAASLDTKAD